MRPAVDIYTGPLVAMTDALLADLKKVFRTKGQTYIYAANGHGGWEAALSNATGTSPPSERSTRCTTASG